MVVQAFVGISRIDDKSVIQLEAFESLLNGGYGRYGPSIFFSGKQNKATRVQSNPRPTPAGEANYSKRLPLSSPASTIMRMPAACIYGGLYAEGGREGLRQAVL